jgi:HdeA/HdeB family
MTDTKLAPIFRADSNGSSDPGSVRRERRAFLWREKDMQRFLVLAGIALAMTGAAKADPVDLSAYADANGFIDVQTLTCGQLANTYQEDANALTSWYSGWYNGLAHKHYADFKKGRIVEHQVIEYCKAHPEQKIIHAIAVILKEDRAEGLMNEK